MAEGKKDKGNEALKAGRLDEALKFYTDALNSLGKCANPAKDDKAVLRLACNLNAALACLKLQDWEAAEAFASEALKTNPRSAKAHYRRGLARSHAPELIADARRDFQQALKLEPAGEAAQTVRAELAKLGQQADATSAFRAPAAATEGERSRFEYENMRRQQMGDPLLQFAEWKLAERQQADTEALAYSWSSRVKTLAKAGKSGDADKACSSVSSSLDKLIKEPKTLAKVDPSAYDGVAAEQEKDETLGYSFSSGKIAMVAPGPFLFDGDNSRDIAYDERGNPDDTFSVDLCACCNGGKGTQSILTSRDMKDKQSRAGFMFYVEPEGKWSFWVGAGTSWKKLYGPDVKVGEWTHLRGVVDTRAGEARFYVDHKLVDSASGIGYLANRERPLRLGAGATEANNPKFFFFGDVRDVILWGQDVQDKDFSPEDVAKQCASARQDEQKPASKAEQLKISDVVRKSQGDASGKSSIVTALRWCANSAGHSVSLPAFQSSPGSASGQGGAQARGAFHRMSLEFLAGGASVVKTPSDTVNALFLAVDLQARVTSENDGDVLRMAYDRLAPAVTTFAAVVLQCAGFYHLLFELDGVCTLAQCIGRQKQLRSGGWITQKDVAMWFSALETLAFSSDPSEVERVANTVFFFGYWSEKGYISPDVQLADFEGHSRNAYPRIRTSLAQHLPRGDVEKSLGELAAAAAKLK